MAISVNYATPVLVNGFSCRNCSEVDQAKRNIDLADPAAGPFGLNGGKRAAGLKAHKVGPVDPAALEKARQQAHRTQGSAVLQAYAGTTSAGQFVQVSA